jgi:hypothetical protein
MGVTTALAATATCVSDTPAARRAFRDTLLAAKASLFTGMHWIFQANLYSDATRPELERQLRR